MTKNTPLKQRLLTVFLCLLLIVTVQNARADDNTPRAMLILDGSGSMWGKIKDGHKILVTRKAIASAIRPFEDKIKLGLMSYGHRKRGTCKDIQILQTPKNLNPLQFSRLVNRIKPLGKTPITSAIAKAKHNLSKNKNGGSIILLADGPENCRRNPCALVTKKYAEQNNITVHVIAFAMRPRDAASLKCLAINSGGLFSTPNSKESLELAITRALNANLKSQPIFEPKIANKIIQKKVKPGFNLSAHLGPNTPPLTNGIKWNIEKLTEKNTREKDIPPWTSSKSFPTFDMPPGNYRITADFDDYQIIKDINLKTAERMNEKFIFNLSELKLPAGWATPDSRSGFGKLLLEANKTNTPNNKSPKTKSTDITIIDLTEKAQSRLIPSGAYKIIGIENGKMQNWFIHARPGATITVPIWKKTGRIRFLLKNAITQKPARKPITKIYATKLKPDVLVEVARSAARTPQFDLAAGSYLAHIKNGYANTRYSFKINNGNQSTETIHLEHGSLSIQLNKTSETEKASLEIFQLTNKSTAKHIAVISNFYQAIHLNQGRYRLVLRTAPTARAIIKDIKLNSGETKTVHFSSRQAKVSFSISNRTDALSRHQIFWQLFDKSGHMIWQSTEPEPKLLLSAGAYKIAAEIGDEKYQRRIRLKGSNPHSFDLSNRQVK